MALIWKALLSVALVFVICVGIRGDAGVEDVSDRNLRQSELDRDSIELRKHVAELEARLSIADSSLKQAKQESFEKSKKIVSLESEIDTLQKRATGDLQKKIESLETKAEESGKRVEQLEGELKNSRESAERLRKKLESSEDKVEELSAKLKQAEKSGASLRKKLRDAEEARRIAESLLLKAESEAAAKAQELYKVYEDWLPPWAAGRLAQLQATSAAYWAVHGEPFLRKAAEEASRHATTAKDWAAPHVTTLKEKVGPVARNYWETVSAYSKDAAAKACDAYKLHASPYVTKVQKQVAPHIKTLKKQLRPYVDHAAVILRPHYEKAQEFVAPHVEKFQGMSKDAMASLVNYHNQMQKSVRNLLLKHEVSAPWAASKELVWFLAMALLVLPAIMAMYLIMSSFGGGKKVRRPNRSHNITHKKNKKAKQPSSSTSTEKV